MSEAKTITKTRALELAKNVSDALKAESEALKAAETAKESRRVIATDAAAECAGVIFECADAEKTWVYIAGVKGGTVGFRKCLPSQRAKAVTEGVTVIKLPASTTISAA